MNWFKIFCLITLIFVAFTARAQEDKQKELNISRDSLYISEIEDRKGTDKVLHAEPLYIDLIRDLGARKGEKEWNLGLGIADNKGIDNYKGLIEYEWAPVNRLGLEIEVPFTMYSQQNSLSNDSIPSDRIESLKLAAQWSFFVSERIATSMAIGYIQEFEFTDLDNFGNPLFRGNIYNPFFIVAKRWGRNFHTLIYTGPRIEHAFETNSSNLVYEMHTNFHYMITGTRNFVGAEINKHFLQGDFDMTLRPQIRVGIAENFLVGIVAGIPIAGEDQGLSSFARIIWEPGHTNEKH
jgi:hypothetical protein